MTEFTERRIVPEPVCVGDMPEWVIDILADERDRLLAENERLDDERTDLANELSASVSMRDAKIVSLQTALAKAEQKREWQPIETAPKDGTLILLAAPSGYTTTPLRAEVAYYDADYRPLQPWVTYSNDSFTDSGDDPTHWMPLPAPPKAKP